MLTAAASLVPVVNSLHSIITDPSQLLSSSDNEIVLSEGAAPLSATREFRTLSVGDFNLDDVNYVLTDAQKEQVKKQYGTDPNALKMRNQSPRFGPSEISIDTDGEKKMGMPKYVYGIAVCGAVGIGIGVLQLFFTGFYMFMRCCCWRWCMKKKSDHEQEGFKGVGKQKTTTNILYTQSDISFDRSLFVFFFFLFLFFFFFSLV